MNATWLANEIRARVSVPDAAAQLLNERPNRAGFIKCPFHGETQGSMRVYRDHYYCFGCHAYGSAIDLAMRVLECNFMGACAWLNAAFGLGLPIGRKPTLSELRAARSTAQRAQRAAQEKRMEAERRARLLEELLKRRDRLRYLEERLRPCDRDADFSKDWVWACRALEGAEWALDVFYAG